MALTCPLGDILIPAHEAANLVASHKKRRQATQQKGDRLTLGAENQPKFPPSSADKASSPHDQDFWSKVIVPASAPVTTGPQDHHNAQGTPFGPEASK